MPSTTYLNVRAKSFDDVLAVVAVADTEAIRRVDGSPVRLFAGGFLVSADCIVAAHYCGPVTVPVERGRYIDFDIHSARGDRRGGSVLHRLVRYERALLGRAVRRRHHVT